MGILWGIVLSVATFQSPVVVALLVAPISGIAALSVHRALQEPPQRLAVVPAAAAAVVPLVAIAGDVAAVIAVVVVLGSVAAAGRLGLLFWPQTSVEVARPSLRRTLVVVAAPALAASSLVVVSGGQRSMGIVLLSSFLLFDLANFVWGSGAPGQLRGLLPAILTLAVLAVLVAGIFNPPFTGFRPWLFAALFAVTAPAGIVVGHKLSGPGRFPALRRLDSLIVAGPVWLLAARVLLHT